MMSGEDLAIIAPVALMQDLAVQATLGNRSVERNGHHYFAGLSMWPSQVGQTPAASHPELFQVNAESLPGTRLIIRNGRMDLSSINRAPFCLMPLFDSLGEPL